MASQVSCIIPAHNAEAYVGPAIESALNQTRAVAEVIVVDDCSTDGTRDVATRYPVRLLTTKRNSGHATARNIGLRAASHDLIAWLDADDYWESNHVATVVGLLDKHADADVAYSAVRRFGAVADVWGAKVCAMGPRQALPEAFWFTITHAMSTVTRRAALLAVNGFDETIRVAPDFDLWLRMSRTTLFVSIDEVTANYRWHSNQISAAPDRQLLSMWKSRCRFLEALRRDGEISLAEKLETEVFHWWEPEAWRLWKMADLQGLRRHVSFLRDIAYRSPLVHSFMRKSRLPRPAVIAWNRLSSGPSANKKCKDCNSKDSSAQLRP